MFQPFRDFPITFALSSKMAEGNDEILIPEYTLLEVRGEHLPHHVDRCRFAGPEFKLPYSLVEEHFDALDGAASCRLRVLQQTRIERIVDDIHDCQIAV